jgi:hypothetical protein
MNKKAFKSCMITDPCCERCGDIETMEHLLMGACTTLNISGFVHEMITLYLISKARDLIPIVELNQLKIIYKVLLNSLL